MNFITKNLKQAGIFNTALIAVGVVYDVSRLFNANGLYLIICLVFKILAYCFALNYAFRGYKKDAARSYKHFLYAYGLSILVGVISSSVDGAASMKSTIFAIIRLVCVAILAYGKDLGKTKSYALAGITFISSITGFIGYLVNYEISFVSFVLRLCGYILPAVLCIFVAAKYADKEARGAK